MIDTRSNVLSFTEKQNEQLPVVLEKIFVAAQPHAVYSEPVQSSNYTIITASEVSAGGGFGGGVGFGPVASSSKMVQAEKSEQTDSGGGGAGGGGGSNGRPVAIIIIGPEGVTIKPVFDITKIALAGITAWMAMFAMLRSMRKLSKK